MWSRDEIADIADDSVDASGTAYNASALMDRVSELERKTENQQSEIDRLERIVDVQSRQIDLLNKHADDSESGFARFIEHYNSHTH